MGCFSFICKKTGKPINSNSSKGDVVHLFLLKNGKVIEHMYGQYDSYGRVFKSDLSDSYDWNMPWDEVCNLMFDEDKSNGIAAILGAAYTGTEPTQRSENDPEQGWSWIEYSYYVESFHKIEKE